MHLRSIKLRGFKSFPDQVEVKLEPGVAVVVGPNGSGKSNVSDGIVWAAGSLTPSALRAEKPDDVLFAGGGDRPPADHCEVELVFDNEDGGFGGGLDFSEISIARRLVRGGEGQYLVNRTSVRRTDLVELLADVGLGGSMHSIVSQGKVDAVLASKPEDRRALIEEAAGLGKFKQRKHRAELKLARVATQVERARDVEDEVRKRLRPLALQATAAERAEKLAVEIAILRARVARLDLEAIAARRVGADERRQAAALARRSTQEKLTGLLAERERAEEELSDAAGRRETALGALYRLQGASERLAIRGESAAAAREQLAEELAEAQRAALAVTDDAVVALEAAAAEAAAAARDASQASGQAAERARLAYARLAAAERAAATRAEERLDALLRERGQAETHIADATGGRDETHRRRLALGAVHERLASPARECGGARGDADDRARRREVARGTGRSDAGRARAGSQRGGRHRPRRRDRARRSRRTCPCRARPARRAGALAGRARGPRTGRPSPRRARRAARALGDRGGRRQRAGRGRGSRASGLGAPRRRSRTLPCCWSNEPATEGLGSLVVLVGREPEELVAALPVVPLERLLDQRSASVTVEGFGFDPARGELWFAGETAETVLLEMDARRRSLVDEAQELDARAQAAEIAATEAAADATTAEEAYAAVAHLRERIVDPVAIGRAHRVARGSRRFSPVPSRARQESTPRSRLTRRRARSDPRRSATSSAGSPASRRPHDATPRRL